ncbi:hypothetical protein D3C79_665500 [compost metagenome]
MRRIDEQRLTGKGNANPQNTDPGFAGQTKRNLGLAFKVLALRIRRHLQQLLRCLVVQAWEHVTQRRNSRIVAPLLLIVHVLEQLATPCPDLLGQRRPLLLGHPGQRASHGQ